MFLRIVCSKIDLLLLYTLQCGMQTWDSLEAAKQKKSCSIYLAYLELLDSVLQKQFFVLFI